MTSLRAILVDDEPLALERLGALFEDIEDLEIVGTARDGSEASRVIAEMKPDIVFLDVQMPEQSGLRVAAALPEQDRPEIIFVTAFDHYAADAFSVDAADYLLKPVRFDRLLQAVHRARRRKHLRALGERARETHVASDEKRSHESGFWVETNRTTVFVPMDAIDWIEAARDYVTLHTATRSYLVRLSMRALETKLDPAQLMRVHRSAFARPANVVEVQRMGKTLNRLVLRDGAVIQVGPNYANAVAARLNLSS